MPYVQVKRNKKNKEYTRDKYKRELRKYFPEIDNIWWTRWKEHAILVDTSRESSRRRTLIAILTMFYCIIRRITWSSLDQNRSFWFPTQHKKVSRGQRLVSLSLIHPQLACSPRSF